MKLALAFGAAFVLGFVGITWFALESAGVAVIATRPETGELRSTHVWYVERDGEIWLEVDPKNGWFLDVQRNAAVTFEIDGASERYVAVPIEASSGHPEIRSLIREKYGWRDRWVGLIIDTSRSIAVRLDRDG